MEDVRKLARLEAWRSVSDQFQTEVMGQRSIWGDGHGQKGSEPTHTWEVESTEHGDGVDGREEGPSGLVGVLGRVS